MKLCYATSAVVITSGGGVQRHSGAAKLTGSPHSVTCCMELTVVSYAVSLGRPNK